MSDRRILVTGASGFIGRQTLLPLAERGFEVHAVSRSPAPGGLGPQEVEWHHADLLEPGAARAVVDAVGPSHLLHLAWCAEPATYRTSPDNLRWVEASLALLGVFSRAGGHRAVLAGSCFEYDHRYGWCREDLTPTGPTTIYGTCKDALRRLVAAHGEASGTSTAWGRIFFLYGPNEHPARLVSSVATALLDGRPAPTSRGEQFRDFLHVADVASCFAALVDSAVEGTVNVCSGRPLAVRDVVAAVAHQVGRPDLVQYGVRAAAPEPPLIAGDPTRLAEELKWQPEHTLATGVADTVAWWRSSRAAAGGRGA